MRDVWIKESALILCYRILFCAKPVPTFAHDALDLLELLSEQVETMFALEMATNSRVIGNGHKAELMFQAGAAEIQMDLKSRIDFTPQP